MKKEKAKRSNESRPTTRRFRRVAPDRVAKPEEMRPSNTKVRRVAKPPRIFSINADASKTNAATHMSGVTKRIPIRLMKDEMKRL